MTVRELYNWCKAFRYKDAKVYMVGDWEEVDEEGQLTDLYELDDVVTQTQLIDMGLDWEENHEVILSFKPNKAGPEINKNF